MGRDEKQQPHGPAGLAALGAGWSHRHRDVSGGWLRPTVFGAVDGLVTNASLISGLGGGGVSAHTVVLTGVASLVAGAFSMGTGEFISVTNQNELVGAEVLLEQQMLTRFPAAEEEELAGYFRDYGADPQTAARMAAAVSRDPDIALQIHTRQELGVDPQELPSPLLAGVSSLFAFSAGAVIPLLPYLFGASSLALTLALTAVALTAGGMAVGRLHRPASAVVGPAPARLRRPGHRRHLSGRPPHRQRHLRPRKYPVSIEQVDCAIGRWGCLASARGGRVTRMALRSRSRGRSSRSAAGRRGR